MSKLAVLVAQFPSGFVAEASDDHAKIRDAFKEIKGRGYLVRVAGDVSEAARAVWFFSTTGEILRKFLRTPSDAEAVAASKSAGLADIVRKQEAAEEAAAVEAGAKQAQDLATSAVALIAAAVQASPADPAAALAGVKVAGGEAAAQPPASAPVIAPAAAPAAPGNPAPAATAEADGDGDEADAKARFGGTRKAAAPKKS